MMPVSQLSKGENAFEASNQTQSILYVGVFIMGSLVFTPLILACSCCLRKILCPRTLSDPNPDPPMECVVVIPKEITDGRVKRRIENLIQLRQECNVETHRSLPQSKSLPVLHNNLLPTSIQSLENYAKLERANKTCHLNKAPQNNNNPAETRISHPTFTRTQSSQHTCCSKYIKNNCSYSSSFNMHKSVSSSLIPTSLLTSSTLRDLSMMNNFPTSLAKIPKESRRILRGGIREHDFCDIRCKYDSTYCARLQSVLIHEAEERQKNCQEDEIELT